jgi:hypothetical protein
LNGVQVVRGSNPRAPTFYLRAQYRLQGAVLYTESFAFCSWKQFVRLPRLADLSRVLAFSAHQTLVTSFPHFWGTRVLGNRDVRESGNQRRQDFRYLIPLAEKQGSF